MRRGLIIMSVMLATLLGAWPVAQAHQIPTFDFNSARTRLVTSSALSGLYLCPQPLYLQPPGQSSVDQHSFSSPVIADNASGTPQIYQYTYTANNAGTANLWVLNFPPGQTSSQAGYTCPTAANAVVTPVTDPNLVSQDTPFDPGLGKESADTVSGGNLNQAKTVSSPTIHDGYVAIGVGKHLYSWPLGSSKGNGMKEPIDGAPNDTIDQVNDAPLITPPLPATGTYTSPSTGAKSPRSFTSPYAVVGSWNGGVVAYPIVPPANVSVNPIQWNTGTPGTAITSSPTWNPSNNRVYFGISTPQEDLGPTTPGLTASNAPRVIAWDLSTNTHFTIGGAGSPFPIKYSVDSSVAVRPSGNIYVPDQQGDVYKYSPSGTLLAFTSAGASAGYDISNLAVSSTGVYESGKGLTTLYKFNPSNLSTEWHDSALGANMYSPGVVDNAGQDEIFVSAGTHLYGIQGSTGTKYSTTTFSTAPYVAIVPDAGSGSGPRYFLSWINSDPNKRGAVEVWVAIPYHITGNLFSLVNSAVRPGESPPSAANAATLPANDGSNLTVEVRTPSLSTAYVQGQWGTEPATPTTIQNGTFNPTHDTIGNFFPLASSNADGANAASDYPYGLWDANITLPQALQKQPGTYYLNLFATSNAGSSLSPTVNGSGVITPNSAANAIEVVVTAPTNPPPTCSSNCNSTPPPVSFTPTTPPSTVAAQGDLTFQAYGAANHTHPHPYPTADLGDTVVVTLTVPKSQIQLANGETFESAYLKSATLTYPHGTVVTGGLAADPTYTEQIESLTKPMLISGMSATRQIFENWAGFPPPQPPATNDGLYLLTANWTVKVTYSYQTSSTTCPAPNPPGSNINRSECQTTTQTHTATQDVSGTATVNMVITGSDWYIIPTVTQAGTQ